LTIASGSADKTIRIWNAQTAAPARILSGHEEEVLSVSYSPDGTRIASGSADKTIRIWNAQTGALVRILSGHEEQVLSVSYSPDGTRIASGSDDKTIRIWNAKSGDFLKTIGLASTPKFLSHSPDGMMIATAVGNEVRILHAKTGEQIRVLPSVMPVLSVSFSPDGTKIAFCSSNPGGFSHWNIRSGEMMAEREFSLDYCSSICYTSDGKQVIIAGMYAIIIYNVKTETHQRIKPRGQPRSVSSAFKEASEVYNIINEANTHLEDVGFKLTTENGLEFILSWNDRIE
jgi:WD40 repeat protein